MANSNKNIVIIPNINQPGQPNVIWTGNAAYAMTTIVADDNSLFWQNPTGQLFSIANNVTTGTIFAVSDISGVPFVTVNASGNIALVPFGGANVGIGTASPFYGLDLWGNTRITSSMLVGNIAITNTTAATSSTTGALIIAGGIGVAGNIIVGGNVGIGTATVNSGNAIAIYGGNLFVAGNLRVGNTATTIGGIQFSDGTYQTTAAAAATTATTMSISSQTASTAYYPTFVSGTGTQALYINTTSLQVIPNSGNITTIGSVLSGNLSITNINVATSTTTGVLIVRGGAGVAGNIYVGGNIYATNTTTTTSAALGAIVATGGIATANNLYVAGSTWAGNLAITNTTASTSNITGAFTVAGGIGVTGNIYAGNVFVNSNVGIGTTVMTSGYVLTVNGSIAATTKSFVIPHPTKSNMSLRHASLEGPENGVYLRGSLLAYDKIMLPGYWSTLVDMSTITVSLTPVGRYQKLYVGEITDDYISIEVDRWLNKPLINCYYTVYAERKDVPKLMVEV